MISDQKKFECPQCGQLVTESDYNFKTGKGRCRGCGALFGPKDLIGPVMQAIQTPIERAIEGPIEQPEGIGVIETSDELRISWWWFRKSVIPPGVIIIGFDLYFGWLFWNAYLQMNPMKIPWYAFFVPIFHGGIGAVLTYFLICAILNRTVITVTADDVKVWTGPIPSKAGFSIPMAEITKIIATGLPGSRGQSRRPGLSVKTVEGERREMITGLRSSEYAKYIAFKLGEFQARRLNEKVKKKLR